LICKQEQTLGLTATSANSKQPRGEIVQKLAQSIFDCKNPPQPISHPTFGTINLQNSLSEMLNVTILLAYIVI